MYGRIFKSLHILAYIDTDESYRRDIKGIRNLQEGRHALARKICHGRKGELYHRYERGLENQLGALGLALNCVTLWTTVYLDAAVRQLRAQGYPVLEEDMARLSRSSAATWGCTAPTASCFPTWPQGPSASCATRTLPTSKRPAGRQPPQRPDALIAVTVRSAATSAPSPPAISRSARLCHLACPDEPRSCPDIPTALAGPRNCSRSDRSCMPSRRSRRADLFTMTTATLMQAAQTA